GEQDSTDQSSQLLQELDVFPAWLNHVLVDLAHCSQVGVVLLFLGFVLWRGGIRQRSHLLRQGLIGFDKRPHLGSRLLQVGQWQAGYTLGYRHLQGPERGGISTGAQDRADQSGPHQARGEQFAKARASQRACSLPLQPDGRFRDERQQQRNRQG